MKKSGHLLLCGGVIILVLLLVVMYRRGREGFDTQCPNNIGTNRGVSCSTVGDRCSSTSSKGQTSYYTCGEIGSKKIKQWQKTT